MATADGTNEIGISGVMSRVGSTATTIAGVAGTDRRRRQAGAPVCGPGGDHCAADLPFPAAARAEPTAGCRRIAAFGVTAVLRTGPIRRSRPSGVDSGGRRLVAGGGMNWTADRKNPDWEWTVGRVRHAICRGRAREIAAPRLDPNMETLCGRCRSPIPNGARRFAIAAASRLVPSG